MAQAMQLHGCIAMHGHPANHIRLAAPPMVASTVHSSLRSPSFAGPLQVRHARSTRLQHINTAVRAASAVAAPPKAQDGDGASKTDVIDCVIVGGGISGLVTAQVRLPSGHSMLAPYRSAAPLDVVVLHSRSTAGDSKIASTCGLCYFNGI